MHAAYRPLCAFALYRSQQPMSAITVYDRSAESAQYHSQRLRTVLAWMQYWSQACTPPRTSRLHLFQASLSPLPLRFLVLSISSQSSSRSSSSSSGFHSSSVARIASVRVAKTRDARYREDNIPLLDTAIIQLHRAFSLGLHICIIHVYVEHKTRRTKSACHMW